MDNGYDYNNDTMNEGVDIPAEDDSVEETTTSPDTSTPVKKSRSKKPSMDDLEELVTLTVKVPRKVVLALDLRKAVTGAKRDDSYAAEQIVKAFKTDIARAEDYYATMYNINKPH